MTRIVAVSGYKNSGKTTLCRRLLKELGKLGVRTGYIKRTSEEALSEKKTDTGSVAEMGVDSALWGSDGLRFESPLAAEPTPQSIASRYFPDAELVILEGGKELELPKVWVASNGEPTPNFPGIFLIYDRSFSGNCGRVFGSGSEAALAAKLADFVRGAAYRSASVYIGERQLPMKDFVADFVRGGILGMLASLKGGERGGDSVRVYLDGDTTGKNETVGK